MWGKMCVTFQSSNLHPFFKPSHSPDFSMAPVAKFPTEKRGKRRGNSTKRESESYRSDPLRESESRKRKFPAPASVRPSARPSDGPWRQRSMYDEEVEAAATARRTKGG